jgi:hypothetical protein
MGIVSSRRYLFLLLLVRVRREQQTIYVLHYALAAWQRAPTSFSTAMTCWLKEPTAMVSERKVADSL